MDFGLQRSLQTLWSQKKDAYWVCYGAGISAGPYVVMETSN